MHELRNERLVKMITYQMPRPMEPKVKSPDILHRSLFFSSLIITTEHIYSHVSQSLSTELDKLEFVVVGARDFSPEITAHIIGTEVPCSERFETPPNRHLTDKEEVFQNGVDNSVNCENTAHMCVHTCFLFANGNQEL